MPLELGLFLGASRFGQGRDKRITLIVDSEPHRYQVFCSDISGQDIRVHKKDPVEVIKVVRNWLRASRPDIEIPGGTMIAKRYKEFTEHKKIIPLGSQRQLPALRASSRRVARLLGAIR